MTPCPICRETYAADEWCYECQTCGGIDCCQCVYYRSTDDRLSESLTQISNLYSVMDSRLCHASRALNSIVGVLRDAEKTPEIERALEIIQKWKEGVR